MGTTVPTDTRRTGEETCTWHTSAEGSGRPRDDCNARPAGLNLLSSRQIYGTLAETSVEFALSTLLESTEVTT
jgi:hypothetical protein